MRTFSLVFLVAAVSLQQVFAQTTSLYGTVAYQPTRLVGYVTPAPIAEQGATTEYNYYAYTQPSADREYRRQQQVPDPYTYQPHSYQYSYTSPPEQFGGAGSRQYASGASSSQSQSGRNLVVGGSASSSSSGQYDSRSGSSYGHQQPGQYDSRYSQSSSSGSSASQAGSRYDPYGQRGYDSRYSQQAGRNDPRYGQAYQEPVDYSQYPPTLKSLVLSETGIYLWWTDPAAQNGGSRRGGQKSVDSTTKYTVKYSKVSRSQTNEQAEEQSSETSSRDLNLQTLEPGTDYSFSIKVSRNGQETGWSAPVVNRTLEQLPQGSPSNIRVVPTDRDATITISPPEGFKGSVRSYIILYAPSGGNGRNQDRKWSEVEVSGGYAGAAEASTIIRSLQPGEEYFYTIQAVNSRGSSPFSEIQSFKTASGPSYGAAGYPYGSQTQSPYGVGYGREAATQSPYGASGYQGNYRQTAPDYYARYSQTTAYPRYDANTPDYYGRYQTTEDYYARFATSAPDYGDFASTRLSGTVTDPYWAAATQSPAGSEGAARAPSEVRVDRLEDPTEALVIFVPSESHGVSGYEILYTYDPSASDDLWQIETAPDLESQVILVRLTLNTRVYIKVRAKSPYGDSDFSETVAFDTTAATGQEAREADSWTDPHEQGEHGDQAGGEEDHVDEEDPDTAHTRTNRT